MKKTVSLLSWLFVMFFAITLTTSCSEDNDGDQLNVSNPAGAVEGQYVGRLKAGLESVNAYVVVTRETKSEILVRLVCNTLDITQTYPCYAEVDERTETYNIDSDAYYCSGYVKDDHMELEFGEDGDLRFSGDRD